MSTKYKYMTSRQLDREPTGYEHWSHEAIKARKRELEAWLLKKFPMPATETDEDAHIERVLQQHKHLFKSASPTGAAAPPPDDAQPVDGNELLQEVSQFIARYLQCSEHQRTLLALWVLHTYCFCAARVTPYLAIRSADKQSGKTLCLQLLSLLCDLAALTSGGFTARDLAVPMKEKPIAALLFDECQLTLGTRSHPRSPALRAVLAASFHLGLGYRNIAEERNAFLPKAFASRGPLPEELADRCIPIILEPLHAAPSTKACTEVQVEASSASSSSSPSSSSSSSTKIPERFDLHLALDQSQPLRDRLERWAKNNFNQLTNRTLLPRSAFPPNLSLRQQDLCDPLLQIAALVGGPWIERALQACAIVFDLQSIFELRPNLQLLADVRDCFAHHNWPDRLPSELLQEWTDSLAPRPWDEGGPLNGYKLARMLGPFEIRPRNQRIGKADPKRGYELKDFKEPWKKHFGFEVPQPKVPPAPASRGESHGSEIANKNAACNTVSHAHTTSLGDEARVARAAKPQEELERTAAAGVPDAGRVCTQRGGGAPAASLGVHLSKIVAERKALRTPSAQPSSAVPAVPSKPAKNAAARPAVAGDTISHAPTAPSRAESTHQESRKPFPQTINQKSHVPPGPAIPEGPRRPNSPIAGPVARSQQSETPASRGLEVPKSEINNQNSEMSPDTQHGIHRLITLHKRLHLQGLCPPFETLAGQYLPRHLHATLDWMEAHPEWLANFRYKPALEFVVAFQKTLARLTMKQA